MESTTSASDVTAAVAAAREAQHAWSELDVRSRIRAVAKVRTRILQDAEKLAAVIHEETHKPEVEALLGEVLASADVIGYWTSIIEGELVPLEAEIDGSSYPQKTGWIHREPRGTVAVIMPWNFPFALPLRTIVPALLAGNAVVLKPSEHTPNVGKAIADLFAELGGVVRVVQGAGDVGASLANADVDFVVFTGSPATGRKVAHVCADRLVPCALELGGKDAAIVLADADIERAANGIVWGAMMNAGQNCGAVERVYVDRKVADALTKAIVAGTKALRTPEDVGPLTTRAQREIVASHVDAARAAGAEVLVGGESSGEHGYAPTVIRAEADSGVLFEDETFGPVVPIVVVDGPDDAIAKANASRYGLTASLWSKDLAFAEKLARRLKAGVVTINNHSFSGAIPGAPWSGVGESGWGITGSPLALDHFTRPRLVLVDRHSAARELWWFPYSPTLRELALALAAMRGGASSFGGRIAALFRVIALFPRRRRELRSGNP